MRLAASTARQVESFSSNVFFQPLQEALARQFTRPHSATQCWPGLAVFGLLTGRQRPAA